MVEMHLPEHVVIHRRDGRDEVILHRSMALIGPGKVEIKSARGTLILPFLGLVLTGGAITLMVLTEGALPLWTLVVLLLFCLFVVPTSAMALVSGIAGADIVVDAKKGSATRQQGYLGMGIGTKDLVPFAKIDYLEVTVEGEEPDRWHGESDSLRQFALWLVKKSGTRIRLAQVPVPAYGQADGMDRTLAVGNAVAALTGVEVRLPKGWELVQIDTSTGDLVEPPKASPVTAGPGRRRARKR